MSTALYGGTFDPFHKAHRRMVKAALKSGIPDQIYVMPAGTPPHKGRRDISFSAYRYMMAKKVFAKEKYKAVKVSDYEIKESGPSYTISTVRYLRAHVLPPGELLYLIIGSDSLMEIETWHEYPALLKSCPLLVAERPGEEDRKVLEAQKKRLEKYYGACITFYPMKPSTLSSSTIREELLAGKDVKGLPKDVRAFIDKNYLYRDQPLSVLSEEQILLLRDYERKLMRLMSYGRLIHSLNVMYEAVRLAVRFGADPWAAAQAGILHDMAKEQNYHKRPDVLSRIDPSYLENKPILHGPVAAFMVREIFDIKDPAVRGAIYHHSSLSRIPAPLEKIVYLADKIEPARDYADLAPIREMAQKDLDKAVVMTIDGSAAGIEAGGGKVHKDTVAARRYLAEKIKQKEASD